MNLLNASSIATMAVAVVGRDQDPLALNHHHSALIHCSHQLLTELVNSLKRLADLLTPQDNLVAITVSVVQRQLNCGFADSPLGKAGSVVTCLPHL